MLTIQDFCQGHGAECDAHIDDECDTDHGVRSYCDGTCQSARDEFEDHLVRTADYQPHSWHPNHITLGVRGHGYTPESYRVIFEGPDAQAWAVAYMAARPSFYFNEVPTKPLSRTLADLLGLLYPLCEHGMSLDLCEGPDHWMSREQELSRGW